MTNSHVHKICRTCLAYGTNLLPLDQNQAQNAFLGLGSNTNKSFGELLMHCTNIEIRADDGLPQNLCVQCICGLRAAVAFKTMCEESDVKLREIRALLLADADADSARSELNSLTEADHVPNDSPVDPLDGHWSEEWTSHAFENDFLGNVDEFSIRDEDIDSNDLDFDAATQLLDPPETRPNNNNNGHDKVDGDASAIVARAKSVNGLWPCEICNKSFADRKSHKLHVRVHFMKQRSSALAGQHNTVENSTDETKPQRRVSARRLAKISAMELQALKTVAVEKETERPRESTCENFKCKQCNVSFESFASLVVHTDVMHQHFRCDICGKKLASALNLERHKEVHVERKLSEEEYKLFVKKKARKFTCALCDRKFSFKGNLKTHLQTHFPNLNLRKGTLCIHCGKMVGTNMAVHMRRHTGEKPYKCDICGKDFLRQASLNEHRRVHTGEKMYKCDHCGHGFNKATRYAEHMRIHGLPLYEQSRPYGCTNCDRRFSHVKYLRQHICPNTGNAIEAQLI